MKILVTQVNEKLKFNTNTDNGIVYEDKNGVYSAMLNQTDVAYGTYGHNKYYLIQLIKVGNRYIVFNVN
jgi:hypothetical protein